MEQLADLKTGARVYGQGAGIAAGGHRTGGSAFGQPCRSHSRHYCGCVGRFAHAAPPPFRRTDLEQLSAEVDRYPGAQDPSRDDHGRPLSSRMLMSALLRPRGFRRRGPGRTRKKSSSACTACKTRMAKCWCTTGARRSAALYYDSMPGHCRLSTAPPGEIRGEMTPQAPVSHGERPAQILCRYPAEHRRRHVLLDLLPGATSRHMTPGRLHHSGGADRRHPRRGRAGA